MLSNQIHKTSLATTILLNIGFLFSCHSNDLGKQKPDKISVDISLTDWDSGAGKIIASKCANCHTSQRSQFVPSNTPDDLDEISTIDFFKNPENRGLVRSMRKRIESDDAGKQMPPRFATPLYEDEKAVLLSFLKDVENGIFTPQKPGEDDDDRDDDPPPVVPPPPPVDTPVTFNDIAPIVSKACGTCHDGNNEFKLLTREDFVDMKPYPLEAIMSGSMPRRKPTWKDSEDGKLVIKWLNGPQTE